MKTDVKDTDNGYEITMNLPGVKKEDISGENVIQDPAEEASM